MIWLFRVDEVFWGNKPKVKEHYLFNEDDILFDITLYDISLYFGNCNYYLMSDLIDSKIYSLEFIGVNKNPQRLLLDSGLEIYDIVRKYYRQQKIEKKLNELGI